MSAITRGRLDTGSDPVTGTVTVGQAPQTLAVSPDSKWAYVTCRQGLYVIDAASGHARRLSVGGAGAHGVAVSPDGESVWLTDSQHDEVMVLDAHGHRRRGRISVGTLPGNVASRPTARPPMSPTPTRTPSR